MEGIYSITKDGENIGTLGVSREGAYTVFAADCDMLPGLIRLSVYGQGREGYLGVLAPGQGRLVLKKKLSPSAMRGFPEKIEFVGPAGGMEVMERPQEEMKEERRPETEESDDRGSETEEMKECSPEREEDPAEKCMDEEGPFWYASPDGALVSVDGGREMVALPLGDGRTPKNIPGESRVIEGKEYLIYITKELA